jgi:hypothetical protein
MKNIPQGLKPAILLAFFGTTKVAPFQDTIYATGCSHCGFALQQLENRCGTL